MVKTVLDNFCVKSGIFCSRCEEKLKKGQISDLDVRVIRTITELEKENPTLQDVTFHKAVEAGDVMALMVDRRGMDTFLSSGAKLAKSPQLRRRRARIPRRPIHPLLDSNHQHYLAARRKQGDEGHTKRPET